MKKSRKLWINLPQKWSYISLNLKQSKNINKLPKIKNCFIDATKQIKKFNNDFSCKNIYLKIKLNQIKEFESLINTSSNITVEIVNLNNTKSLNTEEIKIFLEKNQINRTILSYKIKDFEKLNTEIIPLFGEVSIDLYFQNNSSFDKEKLSKFLKKFPQINHFSIYLNNEQENINLETNFLNFKRYHLHMWAKTKKYKNIYDWQCIKNKNYVGFGKNTITRIENNFFKNNKKLKLDNKYIEIQDHIDRLNYYIPIKKQEFKKYKKIKEEEYFELIEKHNNDLIVVHNLLIQDLI